MKKNNSPEQKKAWEKLKRTNKRPQPLPSNAVRFWEWNKAGLFHSRSNAPGAFKKGVKGKKLVRGLDNRRVHMAWKKSRDAAHQYKFLSRSQKIAHGLHQLTAATSH